MHRRSRNFVGLLLTLTAASVLAQAIPSAPQTARSVASVAAVSQPPSNGPAMPLAKGSKGAEPVRVLLAPDKETTLSSPILARLKQLRVSLGASISAGQILIEFDCDEPLARLEMAKAELTGAVETHEAKVRMQGLEQASDVEVALAASVADKARAQVTLQRVQAKQCTVIAPWAGRVAKIHVRSYMSVTPGQPLVDLVKSGPLKLRLNVPSRTLAQVSVGRLFDVTIDETGKTYQARVAAINSRVDPVSQTVELEANMTRLYPDLLPGMSGIANLGATQEARP